MNSKSNGLVLLSKKEEGTETVSCFRIRMAKMAMD